MYIVVRSYSGEGASEILRSPWAAGGGREETHQRCARLRQLRGRSKRRRRHDRHGLPRQGGHGRVLPARPGWVKENVSAGANPPVITEGNTVLQFSS